MCLLSKSVINATWEKTLRKHLISRDHEGLAFTSTSVKTKRKCKKSSNKKFTALNECLIKKPYPGQASAIGWKNERKKYMIIEHDGMPKKYFIQKWWNVI